MLILAIFGNMLSAKNMNKDIQPKYYPDAKIQCACGNVFSIGSTKPELKVEICSACHPFFTGKEKMIDAAGRVEKFKSRASKKSETPKVTKIRKKTK